ncbi:MAG: tRNA (N(6)-L-threonylcarbamoyladenosine(37)-C(2))-methylthiotransferase MtaB [Ignavibacteriales bacterium]
MRSVAFYTLGCKVNQVETEALAEAFDQRGYLSVDFSDYADVYIINTCSVTHVADRKSRAAIRRARRRNPQGLVVVTGCFAEIFAKEIRELPEVDLIVNNRDKEDLADYVERHLGLKGQEDDGPEGQLRPVKFMNRHQRTRGFIKIQDGCENFCSYCIVPYARGPVRSKNPDHIKDEICNLVNLGYKEIVLNGIHIGQYGKDLDQWNLSSLLDFILREVPGSYRIRLGSVEPNDINDRLLELLLNPRVCRHLHIPMQSGSSKILGAMNRTYNAIQYADLLERIQGRVPGIGLTTDVMVGFPGEGHTEFRETLEVIADSPLSDLHVFKYSSRPGTPAADMADKVSEVDKNLRSQELIVLGQHKKKQFLRFLVGQDLIVLTEESSPEGIRGLSDNYVDTLIDQECTQNDFYKVKAGVYDDRRLKGTILQRVVLGQVQSNGY